MSDQQVGGQGGIICYHGTMPEYAATIREEGFRPDSWFAFSADDAGHFGPMVLAVQFPDDVREHLVRSCPEDAPHWQFHVPVAISPDRILP
jgi:hypothetical protein